MYDAGLRTEMIYLGKRLQNETVQYCRFSHYEGMKLLAFLRKTLNQIHIAFQGDGFMDCIIPFFNGKESEATLRPTKHNRNYFWGNAHVVCTNIKVRLLFNAIRGAFELWILSPLPMEVVEQHKGT